MGIGINSKRRLAATTALAGICAALAGAANAQGQANVEEVIVTGSRLPRQETEALQPTVVTTAQKVEDSGFINLGNVLRQSPLFQPFSQTTGDRANKAQTAGDAGVTFANLYSLGSQRTLTLINGARVVGAASPNGSGENGLQVDISAIPVGLVSRIETISVGGAPIYGSDAIAGTVNIILKDDYEGLSIETQAGLTEHGDGENGRVQVLAGANFAEGRGNVTVSAAYTRQDPITAKERGFDVPFGNINPPSGGSQLVPVYSAGYIFSSANGRPSSFFGLGGISPTTGAPVGFYSNSQGQPLTFDSQGNLVPFNLGTAAGAVVAGAALITNLSSDDEDTTRQANDILTPSERIYLNGSAKYDVSENVTAWTRFSYTQSDVTFATYAPFQNVLGADAASQPLTITTQNPFLRPSARAYFNANPSAVQGGLIYLNKELTDVTDGSYDSDQTTYTIQAGLRGDLDLAGRKLDWDLTASQGRTRRTISGVQAIASRVKLAEDSVYTNPTSTTILPTPANLDIANFTYDATAHVYRENGTGNLITCRARVSGQAPANVAAADISNCAPYNPFGRQNPEDALQYLRGQSTQRSEVEQRYFQGNVNGALFDLPAGEVQVGLGFELRREGASYDLDAATATGLFLNGGTGVPVKGAFNTKELYGEVRAPLLDAEMLGGPPLFRKLEFEGAVRYMDNSQSGKDVTWTAGARLELTDGVMLRGNKTRAVRQPAVAELFAGVTPVRSSVTDPCAVGVIDTGPRPATRRANCVQSVIASGVAANEAAATAFLSTYTTPLGGINGTFAGNPTLESEVADSWTIGAVFDPPGLAGFTASIDWIDIRIKGAIASLGGSGVAAACYDSTSGLSNFYCQSITRSNAAANRFRIVSFQSFYANTDVIDFAGLTVQARYAGIDPAALAGQDPGRFGRVDLDGTLFYLDHRDSGLDGALTKQKGSIGSEEFRGQVGINWTYARLGAYWQLTYYGKAKIDPNSTLFLYNDVDPYYMNDLSIRYELSSRARLQLVVNNVFDTDPPSNAFSYQYDRLGRRYLLGLSYRF